jgi:hypothetical protein
MHEHVEELLGANTQMVKKENIAAKAKIEN